jgi:subtilisin family serine protease
LEHLKNIIEVEFKISESKIEDSIKLELDILAESLQGKVLLAEPSILYHVHPSGQLLQGEPAPQWQWDLIELKEAWQEANSMGAGVQVAVIDRGFYYDDSEIKSAISWRSGLNDDGGFIPIDLMPLGDHGAFCAGLVGARLDRMDVNGVAPECELILATIPRHGVISQNLLAKLIILCADPSRYDLNHIRGADVISCSLGPTGGNWKLGFMMRQAIDFANSSGRAHSGGRGTPVVWAVFNTDKVIEATSIEGYRGVISVSQCDRSSRRVSSGWGPALDLVAPGYGVVGIQWGVNGKAIDYGYGSSLAAPCVAGVAALVMAVNPDLSSNEIADILTCSCDPPSKVKVRNDDTGWGRLNAKEAVRQAKSLGAQLDPLQC